MIFENRELFFTAYNLFHKTFRITFHDFMDITLSAAFKRPVLNIGKFDDWLHDKFGKYENKGLSMYDVLKNNYGELTALKVKELI